MTEIDTIIAAQRQRAMLMPRLVIPTKKRSRPGQGYPLTWPATAAIIVVKTWGI